MFSICNGRILAFRQADTEVDFCFIVEDNICLLIYNVKPELKLNKKLLPIAPTSSPAIANTFLVRFCFYSCYVKHYYQIQLFPLFIF